MTNKYEPNIHNRRSIRLPEYDYSQDGWYYVTLCVLGNKCLFGKYTDGVIQLYQYGRIVEKCWKWLAQQYSYVHLDEYVVMPNHLHGIIIKQVNIIRNTPGRKLWQRNYYEHIIRNEEELNHIRQYIIDNTINWRKDEENPNLQPK